jgi:hypothetical protein
MLKNKEAPKYDHRIFSEAVMLENVHEVVPSNRIERPFNVKLE